MSSAELKKLQAIKSGMNKLLSRVSKVKQELESILDDDSDMVVRPDSLKTLTHSKLQDVIPY